MGLFSKNKEKTKPNKDLELEEFNFDDFDDFGFFDGENRKPSNRTIAKDMSKKAAESLGKKVLERGTKDIIGEDFHSDLIEVADLASFTKDLAKDSVKEVTDTLKDAMPDFIKKRYNIGSGKDDYRRINEQELRDNAIKSQIEQIFNKQSSIEEAVKKNGEVSLEAAKLTADKLQIDVLAGLNNNMAKLTGFMTEIGNEYFRKSLELQYKSYYVQMDTLKTINTYFKGFSTQFDSIAKNTSLPEHVKITQAERFDGLVKDKITEKLFATMWTNNNFVNRVKDNLARKFKNTSSGIKDAITMGHQMDEMVSSVGDRSTFIRDILATEGGKYIGGKLYDKYGNEIKDRFGENDRLRSIGQKFRNFTQGTGSVFASGKRNAQRRYDDAYMEGGLKGWAGRTFWGGMQGIYSLGDHQKRDLRLAKEKLTDFKSPAIFDNQVHRSITESIPLYLARILLNTQQLNERYTYVNRNRLKKMDSLTKDEMVYNYFDRKLGTMDEYKNTVNKKLKEQYGQKDNYDGTTSELTKKAIKQLSINKISNGRELSILKSEDSGDLLNEYIQEMTVRRGVKDDLRTLFTSATSDNADENIKDYLAKNPKVKKLIMAVNKSMDEGSESYRESVTNRFDISLSNVASAYPVGSIKELFKTVSALAGSEVLNSLSTPEAITYGAIFTRYAANGSNYILPDLDLLQEIFSDLTREEKDTIENSLKVLIDDIRIIKQFNNPKINEELVAAFIALNNAILNKTVTLGQGIDTGLEDFNTINKLHAGFLRGRKEVSIENVVGRTIDEFHKRETLDRDEISKLFNLTEEDTKMSRDKVTDAAIFKHMERLGQEAKEAWNSGSNVKEKFNNIKDFTVNNVKDVIQTQFEKLKSSASQLGESLKNIGNEAIDKTIVGLINFSGKVNEDIDELIEKEEKAHQETISNLTTLRNNIDNNTTTDTTKIDDDIRELKAEHFKRSMAYKHLKSKIMDLRSELGNLLDEIEGEGIEKTVEKVRNILNRKYHELQAILDAAKEAGV